MSSSVFRKGSVSTTSGGGTTSVVNTDMTFDASGNLEVSMNTLIAGEDLVNDRLKIEAQYSYQNISTAATTVVKNGAGFLHRLVILGGTTGVVTLYDNNVASGTKIGTTVALAANTINSIEFNCVFANGLTVVTAAATNVTVIYR